MQNLMMNNELILGIFIHEHHFLLRYLPETKAVMNFEGNSQISDDELKEINSALSSLGSKYNIDAGRRILRLHENSDKKGMADRNEKFDAGMFLKFYPSVGIVRNFDDDSNLSDSQIRVVNSLNFFNIELAPDSTVRLKSDPSESLWEEKLNIETIGRNFNLVDSRYKDAVHYTPIHYSALDKLFKSLQLKPDDVVADLGCGKGRMICYAATFPLRKIYGVELDNELIQIAEENIQDMHGRRCGHIELLCKDACDFFSNDVTVYLSYGPFGLKTVQAILENIRKGFEQNPREIKLCFLGSSDGVKNLLNSTSWLRQYKEGSRIYVATSI